LAGGLFVAPGSFSTYSTKSAWRRSELLLAEVFVVVFQLLLSLGWRKEPSLHEHLRQLLWRFALVPQKA
jgi:hypothetical protein